MEWYKAFKLVQNTDKSRYLIIYIVNLWFPRQIFIEIYT